MLFLSKDTKIVESYFSICRYKYFNDAKKVHIRMVFLYFNGYFDNLLEYDSIILFMFDNCNCNFNKMRRMQHSKRITTEVISPELVQYEPFSSTEQLKKTFFNRHLREKSIEKNAEQSPNHKQKKFFENFKKIGSHIFRSHQGNQTLKNHWKPNGKADPEEFASVSPKKRKLILIDQLHTPSKLLRESKSTQCPTPKEMTKIFFGSATKYQTLKLLGRGRFGEVYLARHRKTGFIGALKIMRKSIILQNTYDKRERIIRQITSQIKLQWFLNHPNIIKLYDFFDDRHNIYLFVELGSDGHLFDLMEKKGTFSQESVAIIIREVIRGVHHMHSQSILHRDIKPENIVLTHGMAKICDFGWSVYEPGEFRKTICGTPLYLSPEILKREKYNAKSDIWALGPLVYELLAGENPFSIRKREDLDKIITKDADLKVGSPEIKSFINFILRKDPKKRPDAQILLKHPFLRKYEGLDTSEQICEASKTKLI